MFVDWSQFQRAVCLGHTCVGVLIISYHEEPLKIEKNKEDDEDNHNAPGNFDRAEISGFHREVHVQELVERCQGQCRSGNMGEPENTRTHETEQQISKIQSGLIEIIFVSSAATQNGK